MMLHKIRALRPGTVRYSINGVPGIADDDRAVVSVWPHDSGDGLSVLVSVSGAVNVSETVHLHGRHDPATVEVQMLRGAVESALHDMAGKSGIQG